MILGLTVWLPALYLLLLRVYIVPNISSVFLSSVSLSISIPSCLKVSVRVFMRVLGNSTSPSVFPAFSLIGHSTRNCRSSVRSTTHRLLGLVISLIVCVVLWSPSVGDSLPQSLSYPTYLLFPLHECCKTHRANCLTHRGKGTHCACSGGLGDSRDSPGSLPMTLSRVTHSITALSAPHTKPLSTSTLLSWASRQDTNAESPSSLA